ncbi:MAG: winged helix-turn-helix transcriptional regulator [Bacteroidales bacterium]
MYKKKLPFDIECGVKITMEVMGGKWKTCILLELNGQSMRPSELHRSFPDASMRVIDQQLKELEVHGMISKVIFAELPPRSVYSITEQGKTLIPIIRLIEEWGDNFRPQMIKILNQSKAM